MKDLDQPSSPSVNLAVRAIRERIRSGEYKPESFLPPETGLAESFALSRGTIRRAIEVLVESGELTRKAYSRPRIRKVSPGPLPKGSDQVLVWISHPIADGATLQFLRGISYGLMGTSFRLVVREPSRFYGDHVKTEERQFLTDLLNDDSISFAIVERDAYADNDDLYRLLVERGRHLVFVDTPPPHGIEADYVASANLSAVRKCTDHLLQQGHKRIIYVGESMPPYTVSERIKGYTRAMTQAGLEQNCKVLIASELEPGGDVRVPIAGVYSRLLSPSPLYEDKCRRLTREILKMDPKPTGVIASCDVLAIWIAAALEGAGFSIPKDIAIVGFDWLARWDDPAYDVITTASQDFEAFGYHAAECILDRAYGDVVARSRQILLPAPLLVRSSSVEGATASTSAGNSESRNRSQHFR